MSRQNLKRAKFLLKSSIDSYEAPNRRDDEPDANEIYVKSLDLYAHLLSTTNAISPPDIMSMYLEKSAQLACSASDESLRTRAFYSLARFADEQYECTCAYLRSSEFETRADLMRKFSSDASKTRLIEPNSYFSRLLTKQFDMDRDDVRALAHHRDAYLSRAVQFYLKCLVSSESSDQRDNACVFRLVSLWTENMSQVT